MIDAVVIGAGPNGLAAAVTLARAGMTVQVVEAQSTPGGGARTADLGLGDGLVHDLCSAVHPLAWASPFFRELGLADAVDLITPEVAYAQPLTREVAAVAYHDLESTVARLDREGTGWARLLNPLVEHHDVLLALALGDKRGLPDGIGPRSLPTALHTAVRALRHSLPAAGGLGPRAAALLTGVAAHANTRLTSPAATATGLLLAALAHAGRSWSIPRGGSQTITDALVRDLHAHGGELILDHPVRSSRDLPEARVCLADLAPGAAATLLADRIPSRVRSALLAYRHGAGVAKVDFALSGPVPWAAPDVGGAATVHLGGSRAEMLRSEHDVARGRHAERPVTLVSDPTVLDRSRLAGGLRPLWTYAHVPTGSDRDMTASVVERIEAFAPGFADLVVAARCVPAARMAQHNANYVGGDVLGGRITVTGMVARPTWRPDPYRVGERTFLCSSSTPPGPGVHGLSGMFAARRALRVLGRTEAQRPVPAGGS